LGIRKKWEKKKRVQKLDTKLKQKEKERNKNKRNSETKTNWMNGEKTNKERNKLLFLAGKKCYLYFCQVSPSCLYLSGSASGRQSCMSSLGYSRGLKESCS
jgi:hypothetical protein